MYVQNLVDRGNVIFQIYGGLDSLPAWALKSKTDSLRDLFLEFPFRLNEPDGLFNGVYQLSINPNARIFSLLDPYLFLGINTN